MPEIEIRPAKAEDIEALIKIDHSYTSDHVWQMDPQFISGNIGAAFREVRLPRIAKVDYPHPKHAFKKNWDSYSGVLVALHSEEPVGYTSLVENMIPITTLMLDLVVDPRLRRQGIGTALTLAALDWIKGQTKSQRLVLGMQTKNFPAINLAQRLGLDYCGYIDHYYPNRDIAIFFTKWII
ncbi:MAG: GNAT family N-acetyltransferase [Anaerolineales bacterium]|jgi:ribosomal protein S18 acetylase RimI-like enzyme|nr:GNAT family N-acetyltransferase [Anaerolineales bacterium]HUV26238.1 GNAT family N-acetyltransferase [Anaerolineales bacterium]